MPKAVIVRKTGGPEVLKVEQINEPHDPGPLMVVVRQSFAGIHFDDIYTRKGLYLPQTRPFSPGFQAVGVVEKVGEGVLMEPGTKVAYATAFQGGYMQKRTVHVSKLVVLPKEIPEKLAAASLANGLTAHYLLYETFRVKSSDTILVQGAVAAEAAILCQWAKLIGAKVIGSVANKAHVAIAQQNGFDRVVVYKEESVSKAVKEMTGGIGVPVVYDFLGKEVYKESINSLQSFGLLASVGQSTGVIEPINILSLASKGLFITRPTLQLYKNNVARMIIAASELFNLIIKGKIKIRLNKTYPMAQVAQAHADLESGRAVGTNLLQL